METRQCQNCKSRFVIEPEDFAFYKRIRVPAPTFCSQCRTVRRMNFRNNRVMYKRKVEHAATEVFSSFHPDSQFKVYEQSYWWSDAWDAMEYGKDYDFSRPFFSQLRELMQQVPWPAGFNRQSVNSEYCNNVINLKDCYLLFNSGFSEACAYGADISNCREVFDAIKVKDCELSRELLDCEKCNRVFFSRDCVNCSEVYFSENLIDCHNCFGCINLRHRQYCIFNRQHTKEEYKEFWNELNLGSYRVVEEMLRKSADHFLKFPHKYIHGQSNSDVSGDYLDHSQNTHHSYFCREMEDCKYCQLILFLPTRDSYDLTIAGGELCYELEESGGYGVKFSWLTLPQNLKTKQVNLSGIEYSMMCFNSSNLFGCVGLKNKRYCILNKQYTKEEYEELVPKIIKHMNEMPYISRKSEIPNSKFQTNPNDQNSKSQIREIVYRYGEFFPPELSPFAYNETIAQEYFPLTKEQALAQGYKWRDPDTRNYQITKKTEDLPDHIQDVPDSITNEIIQCAHKGECNEQCTTAFKIIEPELQFYRRMNLPLPRLCPNCRHYERLKQRNPLKLWHRKCQCAGTHSENGVYSNTTKHFHGNSPCPNEFETSYAPDCPEIVYCEKCYNAEVV